MAEVQEQTSTVPDCLDAIYRLTVEGLTACVAAEGPEDPQKELADIRSVLYEIVTEVEAGRLALAVGLVEHIVHLDYDNMAARKTAGITSPDGAGWSVFCTCSERHLEPGYLDTQAEAENIAENHIHRTGGRWTVGTAEPDGIQDA